MKIRSRKLYEYLLKAGVLSGTSADIDRAKLEYRRIYKKEWKRNKKQFPKREIRPSFTQKQYASLKLIANETGFKYPTTYAKQIIISSLESKPLIPNIGQLQKVSQLLGMSSVALMKGDIISKEYIHQADALLLEYLKSNNHN